MREDIEIRLRERVRKYLINLSKTLEDAKRNFSGDRDSKKVLEEAERYFNDAKYYFDKQDYETALVAVAYAEGLLDALRMLGHTSYEWLARVSEKRVFVGGTFDIIHPGHVYLLKEASKYGKLYVAVARDANSLKYKGREPINPEYWRLEVVSSIRYVYQAFLGDEEDIIRSVEKVKPDVIMLGPDQRFDERDLVRELRDRGLENISIVRLSEKIYNYSTTGVIRKILDRYCIKQ